MPAAEHRVAHRAAHQRQLVPGGREPRAELVDHRARSGRARRRRLAGRRPAGRSPAVGDLRRRARSNTLVVSGGPGSPQGPGTTVGACSARRRCRAPWQGWLRRGARRAGVASARARRLPGVRRERRPSGPDAAAGAADALDHARLHPRPRPDHHPRHDHQRLRRGVDGDQRGGLLRLDRRSPPRPSSPPRHRPRSTPTSATGSPSPARSTTSTRCSPARRRRFTVRLPRSKLPVSTPGVYWFGVHALGADRGGSQLSAAGRDRTFLPLVPASVTNSGRVEQTSLVLPVRAGVIRAPDGTSRTPTAGSTACGRARCTIWCTGTGRPRPSTDLGGRPCRGRRRTPACPGQPAAHACHADHQEPGRRPLSQPVSGRHVIGLGGLHERCDAAARRRR